MLNDEIKKNILQSLINNTICYIYWLDQNNIYQGCNYQFASLTGLDSNIDITGKTNLEIWQYANTNDIKKIDNNNKIVLKSDGYNIFEEKINIKHDIELSMLSQKSVIKNNEGSVIGLLCISFNISDIKKKEEYLSNVKELAELTLHQILAYLPNHVYWKDVNGVYLGCNDRQAKSLGKESGSNVVGKTDFELPWGKDIAEIFRKNDIEVMKTKSTMLVEEKHY
jgi:transcriptional regulator with PAS, ATPase and Fis domain